MMMHGTRPRANVPAYKYLCSTQRVFRTFVYSNNIRRYIYGCERWLPCMGTSDSLMLSYAWIRCPSTFFRTRLKSPLLVNTTVLLSQLILSSSIIVHTLY